jgi:hypothetical protein
MRTERSAGCSSTPLCGLAISTGAGEGGHAPLKRVTIELATRGTLDASKNVAGNDRQERQLIGWTARPLRPARSRPSTPHGRPTAVAGPCSPPSGFTRVHRIKLTETRRDYALSVGASGRAEGRAPDLPKAPPRSLNAVVDLFHSRP